MAHHPYNDPDRASEIATSLGLGSEFERDFGYYADAVSPMLPTLPEGWEKRLIRVQFDSGVSAWFLEPIHSDRSRSEQAGIGETRSAGTGVYTLVHEDAEHRATHCMIGIGDLCRYV